MVCATVSPEFFLYYCDFCLFLICRLFPYLLTATFFVDFFLASLLQFFCLSSFSFKHPLYEARYPLSQLMK